VAPFMATSGHNRGSSIGGWWHSWEFVTLLRGPKEESVGSVDDAMADRGQSTPDCRCARCILGRSQGGQGGARPNMEGEDPVENGFRLENSVEETRSLMCVEGELNASLLFEHGNHQPTSTLWVARILLGRSFRERLALGRTMKAFSKHYCKEVMRSS
jgi:hypothetical protein